MVKNYLQDLKIDMVLEIITSEILPNVKHGFFTRSGGKSTGVYQGLNCGSGSKDQSNVVSQNRRLVTMEIGVEHNNLASVHQVHSANVVIINQPITGEKPKADAMVSKTKGIALGILTADCAPILFHDYVNNIIGAAHSGWKGALAGIALATIEAMESIGAHRDTICATIGPCISQRNYEVDSDFFEHFLSQDDNHRFFVQGKSNKYQFDLPSYCLNQLRKTKLKSANWTGHCTYEDPERFYSYRRMTHLSEPDYGRLISVIAIP